MASKARTRLTNKKPGRKARKPGTTPADRRLLARAEQEDGEAKPPSSTVDRIVPALAPKPSSVVISAGEYESIVSQLKELTHVVVDAWATQDGYGDGLEQVLVTLHAARLNLESCASEVSS